MISHVTRDDIRRKSDEDLIAIYTNQIDYVSEVVDWVTEELAGRLVDLSTIQIKKEVRVDWTHHVPAGREAIPFLQRAKLVFLFHRVSGVPHLQLRSLWTLIGVYTVATIGRILVLGLAAVFLAACVAPFFVSERPVRPGEVSDVRGFYRSDGQWVPLPDAKRDDGGGDGFMLLVSLLVLAPFLVGAWSLLQYGPERVLRRYVVCQLYDWYGGLSDLVCCGGVCPGCGSGHFMAPRLIDTTKLGETRRGIGLVTVTTYYRHRYEIIRGLTVADIRRIRKRLWRSPPDEWWRPQQ